MLDKLYAVQNGKYLKVNIDTTSVAPSYYYAGGFKKPVANNSLAGSNDFVKALSFPGGKVVEQIKSPRALHEVNRRKRKDEIEKENYRVAHKLYSTKAALAEKFNFKKDYDLHLKVKTLRCKFPVIDMKQNRFNPVLEMGRPAQSTKNSLGPNELLSPSNVLR